MTEPDIDPYTEYRVTPRYLAGSASDGDAGFSPLPPDWPHHYPNHLGTLVVTSPDRRIQIGWDGDGYLLWRIGAYLGMLGARRWLATANHATPPEIIAGLTSALVRDYDAGEEAFLAHPTRPWHDLAEPLFDAGWTRQADRHGIIEIVAPDGLAGLSVDPLGHDPDDESFTFWAGPPGWLTRAEITFTALTPDHLVLAMATAMVDPQPVVREWQHIHHAVKDIVHLEKAGPVPHAVPVPTPRDVRDAAVTAALDRVGLRARGGPAGQAPSPSRSVDRASHRGARR